ncbi:thiamine pyrophosphate protein domain protein TPP-binding [Halorubrum californiense DSM 19288]|uniref:Thiamine pyrophosphate protein domain protein TPP-binding n=1 Tax=Halorubrum californiense DSM 19288 TaxID=1227465 RepID=M0E2V5_9EURY|nr:MULTISPECIES: thiamine pyrophosphate-binding protein [Halorubrum]ELZ42125.1 thiamine pyrophosphate protein domain protein TPP-binding [Halorubrum californiense DSM 19288]TKX65222.1 thiamine pyrophosphate-binding protein [Halorubrum sp. GN11GM_10-3_MGM]
MDADEPSPAADRDDDPPPTVAEAVVDAMLDRGVDTVFGIPGKQTLPLNRALADRDARFVVARHETAVPHQAWGYAETSDPGEMAATCVVPGPGDTNAMNGLKNALNDCVPLLHLAVETERSVRGGDGIHETPPETYDTVVKENVLVDSPAGAVPAVVEAIRTAREHPQGPVRVGIPKDLLAGRTPQPAVGDRDPAPPPAPTAEAVNEAADLLAGANSPVVLAGGGVRRSDASDALRSAAEGLDAPVVTTYKGKGTLPETHPLSAGVLCGGASAELRDLLASADVGLVVGSDLDAVATATWSVSMPETLVHVTLDGDDVGFGYETDLGVVADADRFLRTLDDRLDAGRTAAPDRSGAERAASVRAADRERFDALSESSDAGDGADDSDDDDRPLRSVEVLSAVRDAVPDEAVVAADAGGFRLWTLVSFPAAGPQSYVNPGSWATMGTGLPSALGAKLANPDRDVVALTGDGGLMMCVHELHTLASEGIDVTVVALNNDDYAIISEEASRSYEFPDQSYGWAETGLDLVAVASGMGLPAERVRERDAVGDAVERARARDGPALVEVVTDPAEPQASEWMTGPHPSE